MKNPSNLSIAALADEDLVDEATFRQIIGGVNTPISRATLWRGVNAGRYPKPLKIAAGINRWRVGEARAVIVKATADRDEVAA
jgi:predicted DNA-binding transcriptional regulator AlpA